MLIGLLVACSDYSQTKVTDPGDLDAAPDITADPLELTFDALGMGESESQTFAVQNVGNAALDVTNVQIEGTSAFTLDGETSFVLDAGAAQTFTVTFSPVNVEDNARIHITSDDADTPELVVPVSGTALVPELTIEPDPLSFGSVPVGCGTTSTATVWNTGFADLVVSGLVEVGDGFSLDPTDLPFSLGPGESKDLTLSFTPAQLESSGGELWVTSNDLRGTVIADQTGVGSDDDALSESFLQGDGPWDMADVLVYVDQSGSMANDQENLASNIGSFVEAFSALDVDWQLMGVVSDSGCHSGRIFTNDDPPTIDEFRAATSGLAGTYTEAGLTIAYNALGQAGDTGCNAGFLRDGSKTTAILVSDEPEQSPFGWVTMVPEIQGLAPNVVIDAIVGDYPEGCETAYPGEGYVEAAAMTGGASLSICSPDWGAYFDAIATITTTGITDTFVLANHPDPSTLAVTVDGTPTTDWTYDEALNAVVFNPDAIPAANAYITVVYRLDANCDQ